MRGVRLLGRGLVAALVASVAAAAAAHAGSPAPGANGVGDSFFPKSGNGGYDVSAYDIYLRYDPEKNRFRGGTRTEITATVKRVDGLSAFNLDYRGPEISEVLVNGDPATFSRDGQELTVTPASALQYATEFDAEVRYKGKPKAITDPDGSLEGWVRTDDGAFVVGEPRGNPTWFPSNDHPTDKALFQIAAELPKPYKAVSNGTLEKVEQAGGDRRIFIWSGDGPMATYLATATVGKFDVTEDETVPGPIDYYYTAVDKAFNGNDGTVSRSVGIADFLAESLGPYPFDEIGGIVDPGGVGYALETQTRPIYESPPPTPLTAHELAHQWYGNQIVLADWSEIWLNEGFATWAQWWHSEQDGGNTVADKLDDVCSVPASSEFWELPPAAVPGPEVMFSLPIYDRGGAALQALRETIGDTEFFAIMEAWASQDPYGAYTTEDLIDFVKANSDVPDDDISDLFQDWVYDADKPDGCTPPPPKASLDAAFGVPDLSGWR